MEHSAKMVIISSIFLITMVFMTGCSDNPDAPGSSGTVATATTTSPLFTAGDIVRSTTGSDSPAWLVLSYDSAGDSYKRALIYKNSDGSYGYRVNSNTETSDRAMMEKVYTVKIARVAVSSIPTSAPNSVTTGVTTTTLTTKVTTAATTTTRQSTARPSIKDMDPDEGEAGTTVSTDITGFDFMSNLTATLRRSGEGSITASKVTWLSTSSITCTFELANTTRVGPWDIVITNPNGLSGEFTNYFTVRGNRTAT